MNFDLGQKTLFLLKMSLHDCTYLEIKPHSAYGIIALLDFILAISSCSDSRGIIFVSEKE